MRRILFIFTASTIIIFLVVIFIAVSFYQGGTGRFAPNIPSPTKVPGSFESGNTAVGPVQWDNKKSEELIDAVQNRKTLSPGGVAAKQKLIASLNNASGNLYSSPNIFIAYIKSPDVFQVEINTTNIAQAKQEAKTYMTTQGFTTDDLCKLPLSFFLNFKISQELQNTNTVFNPLLEGCN